MALKTVLEKLDDVPTVFHEHYVEVKDPKTGKTEFVLGLDGPIDPLPAVKALKFENGGFRTRLKEMEAKYGKFEAFKDMDPQEILVKLDRIAELEAAAGGNIDEKKVEAIVEGRVKAKLGPIERASNALKTENESLKAEVAGFKSSNKMRAITDKVREAALKLKLMPEAVDDAIMLAERVMDVDEEGNVTVKDKVGYTPGLDVAAWLSDMQSKRPHWWGPSAGGGSNGNRLLGTGFTGANPWGADSWNLTAQGTILKSDPKRAEQLAIAAGTTIGGKRPAPKK